MARERGADMRVARVALAMAGLGIGAQAPSAPRGASEIPESQYVAEIRRGYNGRVVVGHDLDVY
jgi:hypothetical protein